MITKALIVRKSDTSSNKYVVRIPILNGEKDSPGATADSDLSEATVACPEGVTSYFRGGDIVYVAFEDNDNGRPIIIGSLYLSDKKSVGTVESTTSSLKVTDRVSLPYNTSIGKVTPENIKCLEGLNSNLLRQLNYMQSQYLLPGTIHIQLPGTPEPAELFGGEWEDQSSVLGNNFLLVGPASQLGTSGGEKTHVHTLEDGYAQAYSYYSAATGNSFAIKTKNATPYTADLAQGSGSYTGGQSLGTDKGIALGGSTGSSENMPPYMTVTVWKKVR